MQNETKQLDELQAAYGAAVEDWVDAIRQEESLALGNHSAAQIHAWERAHFRGEDLRNKEEGGQKGV